MEGALAIWQTADRDAAIAVAIEQFGHLGEKKIHPQSKRAVQIEPARY